jgi:hypothetical protein
LLRRGVAQDEIGIITPYNAQADLIRQQVDALVEVHTIDKYQVNITVLHGQVTSTQPDLLMVNFAMVAMSSYLFSAISYV